MKFLKHVEPNLSVPSIEETIAWYQRVLGWKGDCDVFDKDGKCLFGGVFGTEDCFFNLSKSKKGVTYHNRQSHVSFMIKVDDVDSIHTRIVKNGWKVSPPRNQHWGGRIISLQDNNGFHLTIYQLIEQPTLEEIRNRFSTRA
jgi:predicted enzyme related to lactoylglutathione lyase